MREKSYRNKHWTQWTPHDVANAICDRHYEKESQDARRRDEDFIHHPFVDRRSEEKIEHDVRNERRNETEKLREVAERLNDYKTH